MRTPQLLLTAVIAATLVLPGCSAKYRLSPKDDTVIMLADNASASVIGRFENSEGMVHWPPSYLWGENPQLWGSDVLAHTAANRAVQNVKVSVSLNGFLGALKSYGAWIGGGAFFVFYGILGNPNSFTGDPGAWFTQFAVGFVGWAVTQAIITYLLPDFYAVAIEGDYVHPPANLGQGKIGQPAPGAKPPK